MTTQPIYCITAISAKGVVTLTNHMGRFRMFSHLSVLERRGDAPVCLPVLARAKARAGRGRQRAATPPLSNTGINKGEA